jgi:hypothetical protein
MVTWSDDERLRAIRARLSGCWDDPALLKLGPLRDDALADVERVLEAPASNERCALAPGVVVRTELINALLLARTTTKLGPAWTALVLSGHERGRETLVFDAQVREARPYQDPAPFDPTTATAGA